MGSGCSEDQNRVVDSRGQQSVDFQLYRPVKQTGSNLFDTRSIQNADRHEFFWIGPVVVEDVTEPGHLGCATGSDLCPLVLIAHWRMGALGDESIKFRNPEICQDLGRQRKQNIRVIVPCFIRHNCQDG